MSDHVEQRDRDLEQRKQADLSFGDVTGEYLALRRGAGVVSGTRDVVWVTGPDAVSFLDGLLSQNVAAMEPGAVRRSLLLSPRGKLRATLWLLRGHDRVGLATAAGRGETVVDDLTMFKINVDADIVGERRPATELIGPEAATILRSHGVEPPPPGAWTGGETAVAFLPFRSVTLPRFLTIGIDGQALVAAGAKRTGALAYEAVRIESGEPTVGVDVDEGTIPQEAGVVEGAVDFEKGCYLGQELVARIDSRGRVNRHLRGIEIGRNVLPPPGASLEWSGREVGTLTSVAESLELRVPIGLALVRREVAPGESVTVLWKQGSAKAVVRELPLVS